MRILVLGAYGLIGLPVSRQLLHDGHAVTGLARSLDRGRSLLPDAEWIGADLSALTQPSDWAVHLNTIDVVVNAAGTLQAGLGSRVSDVQHLAIIALIQACSECGVSRLVQISAPGATVDASTEFFRSKARADAALKSSALNWVVLRPGLVLSPQAYGGTALLRMLAAVPALQPVFLPDAPVQTVSIEDVARAVSLSVTGKVDRQDIDLVEPNSHRLLDVILEVRGWLGFAPPKAVWRVPAILGYSLAKLADLAGWMGWRSALRSTSLAVLADGVQGDGRDWARISGAPARSLQETLRAMPSTRQERVFARASLAFPVMVLTLSLFWLASGIIGLIRKDAALTVLDGALPLAWANVAVIGGGIADIVVGGLIAFRPTVRLGCLASFLLASAYLVSSALFTPWLWADPLGPMVKVFPALALAVGVAALSEAR